jgi:hypothetical protein
MASMPESAGDEPTPCREEREASSLLREAGKANRAIRLVSGVVAIGAAASVILARFQHDGRVAFIATMLVFLAAVAFLLFSKLAALERRVFHSPGLVLLWLVVVLLIATTAVLFTSTFFGWPLELRGLLLRDLPASLVSPSLPESQRSSTPQLSGSPHSSSSAESSAAARSRPPRHSGSASSRIAVRSVTLSVPEKIALRLPCAVRFSYPIAASGGIEPLRWSLDGAADGLTIDQDGFLRGTVCSFRTVAARVTDAADATASTAVTLTPVLSVYAGWVADAQGNDIVSGIIKRMPEVFKGMVDVERVDEESDDTLGIQCDCGPHQNYWKIQFWRGKRLLRLGYEVPITPGKQPDQVAQDVINFQNGGLADKRAALLQQFVAAER